MWVKPVLPRPSKGGNFIGQLCISVVPHLGSFKMPKNTTFHVYKVYVHSFWGSMLHVTLLFLTDYSCCLPGIWISVLSRSVYVSLALCLGFGLIAASNLPLYYPLYMSAVSFALSLFFTFNTHYYDTFYLQNSNDEI